MPAGWVRYAPALILKIKKIHQVFVLICLFVWCNGPVSISGSSIRGPDWDLLSENVKISGFLRFELWKCRRQLLSAAAQWKKAKSNLSLFGSFKSFVVSFYKYTPSFLLSKAQSIIHVLVDNCISISLSCSCRSPRSRRPPVVVAYPCMSIKN